MLNLTSVQAANLVHTFLVDNGLSTIAFNLEHDLIHALVGATTTMIDELLVTSIEQGGVLSFLRCVELKEEVNRDYSVNYTFSQEDYLILQEKYNSCSIAYKDIVKLTSSTIWWKEYVDELDYLLNPDMIF